VSSDFIGAGELKGVGVVDDAMPIPENGVGVID
jgi:hypothetical protein